MCFPVFSSQKFGFFICSGQICKKKDMNNYLETAYEEFAFVTCGPWNMEIGNSVLENLYMRLGNASVLLDNMIYERLGMSAEDVLNMIQMGDTLS